MTAPEGEVIFRRSFKGENTNIELRTHNIERRTEEEKDRSFEVLFRILLFCSKFGVRRSVFDVRIYPLPVRSSAFDVRI